MRSISTIALPTALAFHAPLVLAEEGSAETVREQSAAFAAQPAGPSPTPASPAGAPSGGPLFIGVDDIAIPATRVDVVSNGFSTAFTGFQVWGSAFDATSNRVPFNNGASLLQWSVNGSVSTIGSITIGGAAASFTGLAWNAGVL